MQSAQGLPHPPIAPRLSKDVPLRQLSTSLLQTYLEINAVRAISERDRARAI